MNLKRQLKQSVKTGQTDDTTAAALITALNGNSHYLELHRAGKFELVKAQQTAHNWIELFQDYRFLPLTIDEAINNHKTPSLATCRKYRGEEFAIGIIANALCFILGMVNVQRKPNDGQILLTASMLYKEYHYLKISELKYCFVRGLYGDYGELYGKIDMTDFARWLKAYSQLRTAVLINKNDIQSQRHKEATPVNPEVLKVFKELGRKAEENRLKQLQTVAATQIKEEEARRRAVRIKHLEEDINYYNTVLQSAALADFPEEQKQYTNQLSEKIKELNYLRSI